MGSGTGQLPAQLVRSEGASDVSRGMSPHAVGHDYEAQLGVDEERVLVPGTSPAPIGEAGGGEVRGHQVALQGLGMTPKSTAARSEGLQIAERSRFRVLS